MDTMMRLAQVADKLDRAGMHEEADFVTQVMNALAPSPQRTAQFIGSGPGIPLPFPATSSKGGHGGGHGGHGGHGAHAPFMSLIPELNKPGQLLTNLTRTDRHHKGYDATELQTDIGSAANKMGVQTQRSLQLLADIDLDVTAQSRGMLQRLKDGMGAGIATLDKPFKVMEEAGEQAAHKFNRMTGYKPDTQSMQAQAKLIAAKMGPKMQQFFQRAASNPRAAQAIKLAGHGSKHLAVAGKVIGRLAQVYCVMEVASTLYKMYKGTATGEDIVTAAGFAVGMFFPPVGIATAAAQWVAHLPAVQQAARNLGTMAGAGMTAADAFSGNFAKFEAAQEAMLSEQANTTSMGDINYQEMLAIRRTYQRYRSQGLSPDAARKRTMADWKQLFDAAARQYRQMIASGYKPDVAANATWLPQFNQFFYMDKERWRQQQMEKRNVERRRRFVGPPAPNALTNALFPPTFPSAPRFQRPAPQPFSPFTLAPG